MARMTLAKSLQQNKLLPEILDKRKADIISQWRVAGTTQDREEAWQALRQLDLLAGAIDNAIRRADSGS